MSASTCKDCGRPMMWVRTENGKAMPLDVMPFTNGNVVIIGTLGVRDSTPVVHVLTNADRAAGTYDGRQLFVMHRATCGKEVVMEQQTLL